MKRMFTLFLLLFVSVGMLHAQTAKSLWVWGLNSYGQLGDSTTIDRNISVQDSATDWTSVSAGSYHTMAIKKDSTLWAWGKNFFGQLGDGTTIDRYSPVRIGSDKDWASVSAGSDHTIAIKTDSTLWAWGSNYGGRLGDGANVDKHSPVRISDDTDWVSVSAGSGHTLAMKKDSTLWAWGINSDGQLGDSTTTWRNVPVQVGTDTSWVSFSVGGDHSLAIKKDGTLWAWGRNNNGQLGDVDVPPGQEGNEMAVIWIIPQQVDTDTSWASVSAGSYYTMATKKDGSLWAWGGNKDGQLGDGTTVDKDSAVQIGGATDWISVSAGFRHTLAIKRDSTLWGWGDNSNGQLGDGRWGKSYNSPVQIGNEANWASVSAGGFHSLALSRTDVIQLSVLLRSYSGENVVVDFRLPEIAKAGTVQLTFSQSGGVVDANSPHRLTFDATFETVGKHTARLDGSSLGTSVGIVSVSSAPNDILVSGAIYTVTISYQNESVNVSSEEVIIQYEPTITGFFDRRAQDSYSALVYPNPTKGLLFIQLEDIAAEEKVTVSLFNLEGMLLIEKQGKLKQVTESMSAYLQKDKAGIYLLQVKTRENVYNTRVIKE